MSRAGGFSQSGTALVAVMWMVAALSLLVGAMLGVSRAELRVAQTYTSATAAAALGDAAIQLAVLEWKTVPPVPPRLVNREYRFDDHAITVRIVPGNGYIDVNGAPESLLADLFRFGAGLDDIAAETLAQRIVDWRDADDAALPRGAEIADYFAAGVVQRPRNGRFATVEDLLQVLGIDLDLFDRIRPFITVSSGGEGRGVDPMAAPAEVLVVLAGGDASRVAGFVAARDAGDPTVDATMFNPAHLAYGGGTASLHIEAAVPVGDGRLAIRGRWIVLAAGQDGTPWQTIVTEPVRFVPAAGN